MDSLYGMTRFVAGANLPWIRYGIDFGGNAWSPAGGVASRVSMMDAELRRLADQGIGSIRWFLLCDGRAGIRFSPEGEPLGLDDYVLRDVESAAATAARHGMRVMFVLFDFLWCRRAAWVDGVQLGGRAEVLLRPAWRDALLGRVIDPLVRAFAEEPAVLAWDIMNEPEWIARGLGGRLRRAALEQDDLRAFLGEAVAVIRAAARQPITVGSAGAKWCDFYRGLGLDFYQVHWYETSRLRTPIITPAAELALDKPVLLGEFPTRATRLTIESVVADAEAAGYAGAFYWSALATDKHSRGRQDTQAGRRPQKP